MLRSGAAFVVSACRYDDEHMFDASVVDELRDETAGSLSDPERLLLSCSTAVHAATTLAAHTGADGLQVDVLSTVTLQLEAARRMLDATEAHLLVELDDLKAVDRGLGLTTSRWLAREAGVPSGVARQRLAVARTLRDVLPEVDEAWTQGRVGFDHARVLAEAVNDRNIDMLRPMLDDLIESAGCTVFHRWRRDTQALAALLDPDGSHDPAHDAARNVLHLSPSDDLTLIRGELTGESALTFVQTVEAVADELFLAWSKDCAATPELQMPTRPMLLAQALVEICRRARATDLASTKAPRVEVTLILDEARPDVIVDPCGSCLPAATVPVFLCDPVVYAAVLDSLGLPTDMGRATRVPTQAQRRALALRDGGCTFPGCDARISWTDAHHTRRWGRGGNTDVPLLALVCRRHHRVAHRHGWSVSLDAEGWTQWTTPTGRTFEGQRHQRTRAGP
jgi:hypothetical protein